MATVCPVKGALLRAAFKATRDKLVDVDLRSGTVLGSVVFKVQGYSCGSEGFAGQPADTLKGENGVKGIGDTLVLCDVLVGLSHVLLASMHAP